jgi:hypothetical protein
LGSESSLSSSQPLFPTLQHTDAPDTLDTVLETPCSISKWIDSTKVSRKLHYTHNSTCAGTMLTTSQVNPFAKRETHDAQTIFWYKIFTTLSWLLAVVSSVYYTFHAPDDDVTKQRTIWGQNRHHHTAFALNSCIASIYW